MLNEKGEYDLDDPQQMLRLLRHQRLTSGVDYLIPIRFDISYFKENPSGT